MYSARARMTQPGFGRILTFKLGGDATLNAPAFGHKGPPAMPTIKVDASPELQLMPADEIYIPERYF